MLHVASLLRDTLSTCFFSLFMLIRYCNHGAVSLVMRWCMNLPPALLCTLPQSLDRRLLSLFESAAERVRRQLPSEFTPYSVLGTTDAFRWFTGGDNAFELLTVLREVAWKRRYRLSVFFISWNFML